MPISKHPLMQSAPGSDAAARIPVDPTAADRLAGCLAALRPHAAALTPLMYSKLFSRFPALRALFPKDMVSQERKLLDSLLVVVEHMREPARVQEFLVSLGRRHTSYGAKPEYYPPVCRFLVESIAETSIAHGLKWNPELESEWTQALQIVSDIMIAAGEIPDPVDPSTQRVTRPTA